MLKSVTKVDNEMKGILNAILNGIPDIIMVYNLDRTISFCNEAGYKFYNKNPNEVKGEKCYEILNRNEKCIGCCFQKVMQTKTKIIRERYIPEMNKFMDACYNPVFNEDGEVIFIIERLRDITEKKILDKLLEDSKKKYKQIMNNLSDALIIIIDGRIVFANNEVCNLTGVDYNQIIDSNIYRYFNEKYVKVLHKKFRNILLNQVIKETFDCEFKISNNKTIFAQITFSYMIYEGEAAILAVIRDVTNMKNEQNKAAEFQKNNLQKNFPAKQFVDIKSIYIPAKIVSGDFYRIVSINENLIVGLITDVRGKGLTAALNISALDLLFVQEIALNNEPITIVENLNKKLVDYYEENYIAVCCFSMDFSKNELKVTGAGINQFIFQKKSEESKEKIVEGAFLGMFEDSEFSQAVIPFESGDKIFFFTDGLDFILDEDRIIQRYMSKVSINEFQKYIDEFLSDVVLEVGELKDDCTMIAMKIK